MRGLDRFRRESERALTLDGLADYFKFQGATYPLVGRQGYGSEELEHNFDSYVAFALKANPIVFSCVSKRMSLFSEARFAWRNLETGKVFGNTDLAPLETPSPSRTTQEMLALCELDASFAGNSYWVRDGDGMRRLRPDWVGIVTGDPRKSGQRATDLLGYTYVDGGSASGNRPEVFVPSEVAHYSPKPDPAAQHRGMSWLTPVLRDIQADSRFTDHRLSVAKEGAVHTFAVKYPPLSEPQFAEAVSAFRSMYEGSRNSGKSIHVSGGADITPLSMDLRALDFKSVQGGGETRIASAADVPAVIAIISEGLQGSSLNAGNYAMARRQFGDLFARPSWRSVCGAFQSLLRVPDGPNVLWWDERDIGFLREDQKDQAEVTEKKAIAMRQLTDAGYTAASVVLAVNSGDLSLLEHSGLFSVQLQPPGRQQKPEMPAANGTAGGDNRPALPAAN